MRGHIVDGMGSVEDWGVVQEVEGGGLTLRAARGCLWMGGWEC